MEEFWQGSFCGGRMSSGGARTQTLLDKVCELSLGWRQLRMAGRAG